MHQGSLSLIVPCPKNVPTPKKRLPRTRGTTKQPATHLQCLDTREYNMQSPDKSNDKATKHTRCQSRRRAEPQACKTQGMLFGDLDPVKYDTKIDPLPKACLNCWSFKHKRKDCPMPKTCEYCCNCGRKGLNVDQCPRCARAFQGLGDAKRNWIYHKFFYAGTTKKENRDDDVKWDNNDEDNYHSPCLKADEYAKTAAKNKLNELKDEDFGWEPSNPCHSRETDYAEPNDLFSYMRAKKIVDELETNQLNNPVNLDETRMAERDSFGENSVVSIDDTHKQKKDDALSRFTGEPLRDFLNLLDAVKHLPVKTQNVVVLQFISERKQQMDEKKEQFINKSVV